MLQVAKNSRFQLNNITIFMFKTHVEIQTNKTSYYLGDKIRGVVRVEVFDKQKIHQISLQFTCVEQVLSLTPTSSEQPYQSFTRIFFVLSNLKKYKKTDLIFYHLIK